MPHESDVLFEKFEILDTLKKDEFAAVYLANHIYLGKKIILKVLNTYVIHETEIIERFKREAKILARLEHPHIIKVLDFGAFQTFFYISFEYFESENLRATLTQKKLSEVEKKNILVQLLQGIRYAHEHRIIHRDIKPENIFVNASLEVKIGDFGLALTQTDSMLTNQYALVGTPSYMSPEQIAGEKLSEKSDMFSLGIVACEMFSGVHPFLGADVNESINNILNFKEEHFSFQLQSTDENIRNVIQSLLRKNAETRKNASEILTLLNVAEDVVIVKEEKKNTIRYKKKIASSVAIGIAAVVFIVFYFKKEQPEITSPQFAINDTLALDSAKQNLPTDTIAKETEVTQLPQKNISSSDVNEKKNPEKDLIAMKEEKKEIVNNEKSIVPPQFGELYVECLPWAYVFIDSVKLETTPLSNNLRIEAGEHEVRLEHPDYPLYKRTINIVAAQTSVIKINLDTLFGFLEYNVFPWGEILVNGKQKGQTPLQKPIKLFPGEYVVTVRNTKFGEFERTVSIHSNDTIRLYHRFENN